MKIGWTSQEREYRSEKSPVERVFVDVIEFRHHLQREYMEWSEDIEGQTIQPSRQGMFGNWQWLNQLSELPTVAELEKMSPGQCIKRFPYKNTKVYITCVEVIGPNIK
jgi:hypothetical protein